ncbi:MULTISPECIES: hypothetical protein [unclassified Moorena]|nr:MULTISPECIES: hypothetical protein [unclassified Moorena]NEP36838.1 hypothetical protein [Moorena sp. SIO3B2]NER86031.1 hypothetical protein [Moorena sp. SIO3A2]NES81805.1 hypothetical protein [Moorena sp. SIO2B7]
MAILVERASWWHGHLGGTGILPVSCRNLQPDNLQPDNLPYSNAKGEQHF